MGLRGGGGRCRRMCCFGRSRFSVFLGCGPRVGRGASGRAATPCRVRYRRMPRCCGLGRSRILNLGLVVFAMLGGGSVSRLLRGHRGGRCRRLGRRRRLRHGASAHCMGAGRGGFTSQLMSRTPRSMSGRIGNLALCRRFGRRRGFRLALRHRGCLAPGSGNIAPLACARRTKARAVVYGVVVSGHRLARFGRRNFPRLPWFGGSQCACRHAPMRDDRSGVTDRLVRDTVCCRQAPVQLRGIALRSTHAGVAHDQPHSIVGPPPASKAGFGQSLRHRLRANGFNGTLSALRQTRRTVGGSRLTDSRRMSVCDDCLTLGRSLGWAVDHDDDLADICKAGRREISVMDYSVRSGGIGSAALAGPNGLRVSDCGAVIAPLDDCTSSRGNGPRRGARRRRPIETVGGALSGLGIRAFRDARCRLLGFSFGSRARRLDCKG
jgi:hypothetical protein